MYLIVIDPGPSTGVAEFAGTTLVRTFTTQTPHTVLRTRLQVLRCMQTGLTVVCEEGPQIRHLSEACERVEAIVREESESIYWVRPSQWKHHPAARLSGLKVLTLHEADAACIGNWFIARGRYHRYERCTPAP